MASLLNFRFLPFLVLFSLGALLVADSRSQPTRLGDEDLVGTWEGIDENTDFEQLIVSKDGTLTVGGLKGTWKTLGLSRLRYTLDGETLTVRYKIKKDLLTITADGEKLVYRRKSKAAKPPEKQPESSGSKGNPLGKGVPQASDPFLRRFSGDGLTLELRANPGGYRGELRQGEAIWPIEATREGLSLTGTFTADQISYGFVAHLEGDRLNLKSGGRTYSLRAAGGAGARIPPALAGVAQGKTTRFVHPKGYFSFDLPQGWSAGGEFEGGMLVNPGLKEGDSLDVVLLVNYGELDQGEVGRSPAALLDANSAEFRRNMRGQEIILEKAVKKAKPVLVKDVPGAVQEWIGRTQNGKPLRLWLGAVVKREYYMTVTAILLSKKEGAYLPGAKRIFFSLAPKPPKRNPEAEAALAGQSIAKTDNSAGGFSGTTYEFSAGGSVTTEFLFSGITGSVDVGGSNTEHGTYEVVGQMLYMYFRSGQVSGELVKERGRLTGVRLGEAFYPLR